MNTADATIATRQEALSRRPHFSGLSHVSLACRDLVESKRCYSKVLGGELVHEIAGFVEYRIADVIFGLSEQTRVGLRRITNILITHFISMGRISTV